MKKKSLLFVLIILSVLTLACLTSCNEYLAPSEVTYDGAVLSWKSVTGAKNYLVRINDKEAVTVSGTEYGFDAEGKSFTAVVSAVFGKNNKQAETTKNFIPLAPVTGITVSDEGIMSWSAVENATGYSVRLDGNTVENVTSTSYEGLPVGKHTLAVKPFVSGNDVYYGKWSSDKAITVLGKVKKLSYDGDVLSWEGLSGAAKYGVFINGSLLETVTGTKTSYNANGQDFDASIKAIGNHTLTYDGELCEKVSYVYFDTVTNVKMENGILKWNETENAAGYKLEINGVVLNEILSATSYDKLSAGTVNNVRIKPVGSDGNYFSSWTTAEQIKILPRPVLNWNPALRLDGEANNNITWNPINGAAGYTVKTVYGTAAPVETPLSELQLYYANQYADVGEYYVYVKAEAPNGGNTYCSQYSNPICVRRLPSPTARNENFIESDAADISKGFKINLNPVNGASGYVAYKNGQKINGSQSSVPQLIISDVVEASVVEAAELSYKVKALGSVMTKDNVITATLDSLTSGDLSVPISVSAMPTNVVMSGYSLSWNATSGAAGYNISIGSAVETSTNNLYNFETLNAGEFKISVGTRGNGSNVLASNYTAVFTIKRLAAPSNIAIGTSEGEGVLSYDGVTGAKSYVAYIGISEDPVESTNFDKIYERISVEGTILTMRAIANAYSEENNTVYVMTSPRSPSRVFTKLATPTYPEVKFLNGSFVWNPPQNVATYSPTYRVYKAGDVLANGALSGTTMSISELEGGVSYEFCVQAIGNGTTYINSEKSSAVTVWKPATPIVEINRTDNSYQWQEVPGCTAYTVYVDGIKVKDIPNVALSVHKFAPGDTFKEIKTYDVKITAIGDGGVTSIDGIPAVINQAVQRQATPEFSFFYDKEAFSTTGNIVYGITKISENARGYNFIANDTTVGMDTDTTFSFNAKSAGSYKLGISAVGKRFGTEGDDKFYIDSVIFGNTDEYVLTLLEKPTFNNINLSESGILSWGAVSKNCGYEISLSINGAEYSTATALPSNTYTVENFSSVSSLKVRLRTKGNGINIISSEWVEKIWNLS